jgi:hypothetical protein
LMLVKRPRELGTAARLLGPSRAPDGQRGGECAMCA